MKSNQRVIIHLTLSLSRSLVAEKELLETHYNHLELFHLNNQSVKQCPPRNPVCPGSCFRCGFDQNLEPGTRLVPPENHGGGTAPTTMIFHSILRTHPRCDFKRQKKLYLKLWLF